VTTFKTYSDILISDIDAIFSKISAVLKRKPAKTFPELLDLISQCIQYGITSQPLSKVYNIKDWVGPYVADLHGHLEPHVYR